MIRTLRNFKDDHPIASPRAAAFTLIELLTVVAIIGLLISILMPSLGRARDQAKGVHCLARLKDIGTGLAAYENISSDFDPPAEWNPDADEFPDVLYGWQEILFAYIYKEPVFRPEVMTPVSFPVQRNLEHERFAGYFICKAASTRGVNSGHYRVYLPGWAGGSYSLHADGSFDETSGPDPRTGSTRSAVSPKAVLIGDSNDKSERGDGDFNNGVKDDCSYIDAGEADISGTIPGTGNRFSDRHYGGTNYLFADLHGEWDTKLREKLSRDFDLNGVLDIAVAP
jgi:prepilin-type N-terminal cleavage/methylation domain-containing protein/prepilin-type processing-associated H-X9-DG protein